MVTPYFDGVAYTMPQTSRSQNCVNVPIAGDWNNDGGGRPRRLQPAAGPAGSTRRSAPTVTKVKLGRGLDTPLVGDWDGDGTTDLGACRALDGQFVLRTSDGSDRPHASSSGGAATWGSPATGTRTARPRSASGARGSTDFLLRLADGTVQTVDLGSQVDRAGHR